MSDLELFLLGTGLTLLISFFTFFLCFYHKEKCETVNKNKEINYEKKTIKLLTDEQIEEIHKKGLMTPEEKLEEIEGFYLCAPGDAIGGAAWRCKFFRNCHECLCDYVASKNEWEPFDFKLVNSIETEGKDFFVGKLE